MTKKEFESLLEEAFLEGYNDAMEEIFSEDASFDLEDEMDNYNENMSDTDKVNIKNDYKRYKQDNPNAKPKELSHYLRYRVADKAWQTNADMANAYRKLRIGMSDDDEDSNGYKNLGKLEKDKAKASNRMYNPKNKYHDKTNVDRWKRKVREAILNKY